jgi:hypothetical protein
MKRMEDMIDARLQKYTDKLDAQLRQPVSAFFGIDDSGDESDDDATPIPETPSSRKYTLPPAAPSAAPDWSRFF